MESALGRPPKNMEFVDSSADHAQAAGELVRLDYLVAYADLGREFINRRHDAIGGYGAWMGNLIGSAPFAKSAMIEQRLVGIAITRLTEVGDRLHLTFLYVDPVYHGQGIGGFLLREVENFAEDRGLQSVALVVFEGNTRAYSLYERSGFKQIGTRDDLFYSSLGLGILMLKGIDSENDSSKSPLFKSKN